jgi:hypothetical protein
MTIRNTFVIGAPKAKRIPNSLVRPPTFTFKQ